MELTTVVGSGGTVSELFMMSKIQNLNGTHNKNEVKALDTQVVYDVKDTKFEWNSQLTSYNSDAETSCL